MTMHSHNEVSPVGSVGTQRISELGETVSNARTMLHSKVEARKQTERDAQLLANRIKLLQQEEAKTLRNIELARARAARLAAIKHEAVIREAQLLEAERQREQDKLAAKDRNNYLRQIEKASRASTMQAIQESKRRAALESRKALRKSVQDKISEEERSKEKSILRTEAIRRDRIHSRMRQEEIRTNRLIAYKDQYSQKVEHEEKLKHDTDELLTKLEQEELALIKRLQRAQELQSKISSDLTSPVLSTRITPRKELPPRVSTPVSRRDIGGAALR